MLRTPCSLVLALLALAPACGPKDADTAGTSTGEVTTSTSTSDSSTLITEGDLEPTTTSSFPPETDPTVASATDPTVVSATDPDPSDPDPSDTIDTIDPCSSTCAPFFDCVPEPDTGTAGGSSAGDEAGSTASGGGDDESASASAGDSGIGGEECDPGFECIDVGACGCEEFKCVPEADTGTDTGSTE